FDPQRNGLGPELIDAGALSSLGPSLLSSPFFFLSPPWLCPVLPVAGESPGGAAETCKRTPSGIEGPSGRLLLPKGNKGSGQLKATGQEQVLEP
ncbi:hypothetical protein EJB05_31553, partial [Eragrostis curvula]